MTFVSRLVLMYLHLYGTDEAARDHARVYRDDSPKRRLFERGLVIMLQISLSFLSRRPIRVRIEVVQQKM